MKDERKNRAENIFSQYLPLCIFFIPLFPIKLNALPIDCLKSYQVFLLKLVKRNNGLD